MAKPPPEEIKKAKGAYHHGDLKAALVEAAAVILETRGLDALSLRAAAKRAGVSEAAPYRHFKDKDDLLAAVVAQGLGALKDEMDQAMIAYQGEGARAVHAAGMALLTFAHEQAGRYRLLAQSVDMKDLLQPFMSDSESAKGAWRHLAFYHGVAMLLLSGAISWDEALGLVDPR
jgi:AcrR family transcriptional regulator